MRTERKLLSGFTFALLLAAAFAPPAQAENAACLKCHAGVADKKVVHGALNMGCVTCHTEIDASVVPHKLKGKIAEGLSAEPPALCMNCHDQKLFEGKFVHAPVAAGLCLGCHDPHSSDNQGLLKKAPAALCLDCHPDITKEPHVVAGFSRSGHPLGNDKKLVPDPLRPGKTFYCASCHEPHRSEFPKLSRYGSGMTACQKCHKK